MTAAAQAQHRPISQPHCRLLPSAPDAPQTRHFWARTAPATRAHPPQAAVRTAAGPTHHHLAPVLLAGVHVGLCNAGAAAAPAVVHRGDPPEQLRVQPAHQVEQLALHPAQPPKVSQAGPEALFDAFSFQRLRQGHHVYTPRSYFFVQYTILPLGRLDIFRAHQSACR
jgi:uncharacterized protein YcbX